MPPSARKPTRGRGQGEASGGDLSAGGPAKPAQRERLVNAMIELASKSGYQAVSIAQLSTHAGVSSQTFYEQFEDKEACLLAAYETARARILPDDGGDCPPRWEDAARASLSQLSDRLQSDPDAGSMVFVEALAGEQRIRRRREQLLADQEAVIAGYLKRRPDGDTTLDMPISALEGARRYIISRHLRTHSVDLLPGTVDGFVSWMGCYAIGADSTPWSTSAAARLTEAEVARCVQIPAGLLEPPPKLPRGRHKLPPTMVARSRRARILAGTADVMLAKGYANASITDIVAAAGVARDVFYDHFENKQHAFLETQQFVTQAVLELCGSAYFSGKTWPERVWRGLASLCGLIAAFPALAYVRVVECYAAGPIAVRGTEELLRTTALFLEEGYSYGHREDLPRISSLAVAGAVFEVIYRLVAAGQAAALPEHLPVLAYLATAPFTGTEKAIELVREHQGAP